MLRMKDPTPLLFPSELPAPVPVRVELTVEIGSCLAVLLLHVLEVTKEREANADEA